MNKASKRILSLCMAAALVLGGLTPPMGMTAYAAMPTSAAGQPYDGVDFDALMDGNIYYGTYKHKLDKLDKETEGTPTPILWRVMGEESDGGNLTLLSEYVLDNRTFGSNNTYKGSAIQSFLSTMATSDAFVGGEQNWMESTDVIAGGATSSDQILYLLSGVDYGIAYWTAGKDTDAGRLSEHRASYKGGNPASWWLRSPNDFLEDLMALVVFENGSFDPDDVNGVHGVRPAFQFNPTSVLFSSKIVDGAAEVNGGTQSDLDNYSATAGGGENYKLTILGENDGAGVGTLTGVPGGADISLKTNEQLWLNGLEPSETTDDGDYTVVYKIVNNSGRTIDGYGFTDAETVTDLKIDTAGLLAGDYTVYTWLQKNNEIHSHEGTMPGYFTLTVDGSGNTYGIGLDMSGTHDFGSVVEGNPFPAAKTVSITNTGSSMENLKARLSGDDADSFTLSDISSDSFTVAPNTGIGAGTYTATVTVTADYAQPQTFDVAFKVTPPPTLTASPDSCVFGNQKVNTISTVRTVAISGTDLTGAITYALTSDTDAFNVDGTSWVPATGGTLSVTFQPTQVETYSATLTISSDGAADKTVALSGNGITVPGAPLNLVATPSDAGITIAWDAPESNGGAAIIGYEVQLDSDGWNTATGTTHTFTGLTNGTSYSLSVRAVNSAGEGLAAMTTAMPSAAATVPGVPLNLVATPGDTEITITWEDPESNGGETIIGYEVQLDSDGWNTATGMTHTFTGLTNGTSYSLSVCAVNSVGKGAEATTTITPGTPVITIDTQPAATTIVTAGSISGSLSVVASVTESATLRYAWYECDDINRTNPSSTGETSDSIPIPDGLTEGTYYYYCIASATGGAADVASNVAKVVVQPSVIGTATPIINSANPINLDLNGAKTAYIQISLGASNVIGDVKADRADVTVTGNAATADAAEFTSDGNIEVIGQSVGSVTISIAFSGGDVGAGDTQYDDTITVNVTDSYTPPASHTLTVSAGTGGTVSGNSSGTYTVDDPISVTATANSGYSFSGWTANGITVSNTQTISFNMPNNNVTLTANFTDNGNSGSSTPDTPKTTIVDKQPNMPMVAEQKVSGTVRDTVLTLRITEKMAKAAIAAAEKVANSSGETADGIAVEFTASNPGRYGSLVALIGPGVLERLKEADVKYVKIGSAIIDITLDAKVITEIDKQTTGDVTVSAMKQDKLSEAAKALIGSRPAFDITVKDSKGTEVSDLKGGTATIGMAYKVAATEETGNLQAVYVDKNGKPTLLTNSSYADGRLVFERGSLSTYGVGYKTSVPGFTDTANHWAKDDIDFIVSLGLLSGTTATTFAPDQAITRADFLMTLGKLSGADVSSYTASSFTDVTDTDPAMPYIEWALKQEIVNGIGDNKFGPEQSITRQDMAVMMQSYATATGYTLPVSRTAVTFADAARISAYAKDAVTAIQQAGIIVGKPGNLFDPQGTATRAEASTMLHHFVVSVMDEGDVRG